MAFDYPERDKVKQRYVLDFNEISAELKLRYGSNFILNSSELEFLAMVDVSVN